MSNQPNRLNEDTELSIPLKNIIGMIVVTAIAVWAYFGVTKRLDFLEYQNELITTRLLENRDWIVNFKDSDDVKGAIERLRLLELEVKQLEHGVCK